MDKCERLIKVIIIIAAISSVTYLIAIIGGIIDTNFRFSLFIPSWAIICIPILTQKRLEEKRRQEIFKKQVGVK